MTMIQVLVYVWARGTFWFTKARRLRRRLVDGQLASRAYAAFLIPVAVGVGLLAGAAALRLNPVVALSACLLTAMSLAVAGDWAQAFFFREEPRNALEYTKRCLRFLVGYPLLVLVLGPCLGGGYLLGTLLGWGLPGRLALAVAAAGTWLASAWFRLLDDPIVKGRRIHTEAWVRRLSVWFPPGKKLTVPFGNILVGWVSVMFVGPPGAGKTSMYRLCMAHVFPRLRWNAKARGVVYDNKGNLLRFLRRLAGCPVLSLHPFDVNGYAPDFANDLTDDAMAADLGRTIVPEQSGENRYFSDAAWALLNGIALSFNHHPKSRGRWTFRDLILCARSSARMRALFSREGGERHLIEKYLEANEFPAVASTLDCYLAPLQPVAAGWHVAWTQNRLVSLRDWTQRRSILVLGDDELAKKTMQKANALLFEWCKRFLLLTENLVAPGDPQPRETYVFIDEVKEFLEGGAGPALNDLLTRGREFGCHLVLGALSKCSVMDATNQNQGSELISLCRHIAILGGTKEPETTKYLAEIIGERIVTRRQPSGQADEHTEPAVLTMEMGSLPEPSPEGGIPGIFYAQNSLLGVWKAAVPMPPADPGEDPNQGFVRRPPEQLRLTDWDAADLERLGLPPSLLEGETHQPGEAVPRQEASAPPNPSGRPKKRFRYTRNGVPMELVW